jgi:hypothetical protein
VKITLNCRHQKRERENNYDQITLDDPSVAIKQTTNEKQF